LRKIINSIITACFASTIVTLASGCGGEDADRYERVTKLRAIGVATNPVVLAAPASGMTSSVELTVFAAMPKGGTVNAAPFLDEASSYGIPVQVSLDPSTAATQSFAALDVYSVKANATVGPLTPQQEAILRGAREQGLGKLTLRYAVKLDSGEESETIVGNILVYPEESPETSFQPLSVTIAEPIANGTVGIGPKQSLSGSITKPQDENIKVSWFVSSGKVTNRRARETKWEPMDAGTQTVIMTARGMKSGSFAMQAVDVTAE